MDDSRFDSLTKSLIDSSGTRRGLVSAGGVGAMLATLGLTNIEAKKKKKKKKCKKPKRKCGKKCLDVRSDPNNCGACGNRCNPGRPNCVDGACTVSICPDDALFCTPGGSACNVAESCGCASDIDGKRFCAFNVTCEAVDCATNADCVARGFGADSACIVATGEFCDCARGCARACPA
jgi:hypothetical protein